MGMPIITKSYSRDCLTTVPNLLWKPPRFRTCKAGLYTNFTVPMKIGMWISITKLEQSCDCLNFMMGIPIKPIVFYGYGPRWLSWVKYDFIENPNIGIILRLVDISWKYLLMCCIWWLTISTLILLQGWAQMRPSTLEFCNNLSKMTRKWYKNSIKSGLLPGTPFTKVDLFILRWIIGINMQSHQC